METSSSADGIVETPSWPSRPNEGEVSFYSFKPNLLRYTSNMAGKACHVAGSATQVGLTQALCRMKIISLLMTLSLAFGAAPCAVAAAAPGNQLSCNIGPVTKSYGGGQWLVYGCSDGKSVALVTPQGNPGFPFVFSFIYTGKRMTLHGEGNGNKQATDAAFKQLKAMTQSDVAALFQQAKAHAKSSSAAPAT